MAEKGTTATDGAVQDAQARGRSVHVKVVVASVMISALSASSRFS
jgi:hypothetical protein